MDPSDQSDRDYFVWGDPYVNKFDQSYLATEYLRTQTGNGDNDLAPLNSQSMPGWTSMSIYHSPDSVDDIWTKAGLIAVRNFETKALADANFRKTCVGDPAPGGGTDTMVCNIGKSLFTPLGMFTNPANIENMSEADIKKVLTDAIANTAVWGKVWSGLFGNEVTAASPKVKFMRSVWSHNGPIRDGTKRYKNIQDKKSD